MIVKPKVSGSTIAYQLRHRKGIERNLFIAILKKLDRFLAIDLKDYRYVGFGAASLEDFKALHSEFGIQKMDCIEIDEFAFSRQVFNKPYSFIDLFPLSSTKYITGTDFKQDLNQIIWWDFAEPKSIRQQLNDIEFTGGKLLEYDIVKFTFNAEISSFINTHGKFWKFKNIPSYTKILSFLKCDETYKQYLADNVTPDKLEDDFPQVLRTMAVKSLNRGLRKAGKSYSFNHISSFTYSDGQLMTTITGVACNNEDFAHIVQQSSLDEWEFYSPSTPDNEFPAIHIEVPVMTYLERVAIDKLIYKLHPEGIAKRLEFFYGTNSSEHLEFINGYYKFHRYLPSYSKVIY